MRCYSNLKTLSCWIISLTVDWSSMPSSVNNITTDFHRYLASPDHNTTTALDLQSLHFFTVLFFRHSSAVMAPQGDSQWPLKNGGNSHRSRDPTISCDWSNPNLHPDQPDTRGGHVSHTTGSPNGTRLRLCNCRIKYSNVCLSTWMCTVLPKSWPVPVG